MQQILRTIAVTTVLSSLIAVSGAQSQSSSTATGVSRLMNPAVSVNGLFLGGYSPDIKSSDVNGCRLQEAELQLTSVVDPFWKADVIFSFAPGTGGEADEAGVEQAVLESQSMPAGLGLRLGKFFLPFGKHAPLHAHQFPFVTAPAPVRAFLGDDGPTDTGLEVVWGLPLPWYSEMTLYGIDGNNDIMDPESSDVAAGGRLSNLWDVSDGGTLELGFSGLTGPVADAGTVAGRLDTYGADLTYKWSSWTRSQGRAVNATCEFLLPDPEGAQGDPWGLYGILQYRFQRNWWLGLSAGTVNDSWREIAADERDADHGPRDYLEYKANLTFTPSEFSALRAEVSYLEDPDGGYDDLRISLQWNFTIGAHPAHLY